ncbi:hypothetical protein LUZ60_007204 [Juncus effusus]|nr:hypothetical protein LUZ60_007204 [Juncus effusus]
MGGKGRRRREKNFLSSHGGDKRLPPPPKVKELDALPSKLRRLMQFKNSNNPDAQIKEKDEGNQRSKQKFDDGKIKDKDRKDLNKENDKDANEHSDSEEVNEKKKKKRKVPMDLRFGNLDEVATNTRKKKRKEFLDAKKKKHKKENNKEDEVRNFLGREEIKFGEIVQAPPKLSFPKAAKSAMEASKERLRLKAIEEYRNRRNWDSRPGIQLPDPETPTL